MMMVKAGRPVDELISQLLPFLSSGDVIIDGGNSDFHDTERRVKELEKKGIYFHPSYPVRPAADNAPT